MTDINGGGEETQGRLRGNWSRINGMPFIEFIDTVI